MGVLEEDYSYILDRVTPSFKNMAGSVIYISGAAGFVGSYLMGLFDYANEHYFDQPAEIYGYDLMIAPSREVTGPHCTLVKSDVVLGGCDYYMHLASIASPQLFLESPLATIYANVQMTEAVLKEACLGAHSMVHFSSCEVYGDPLVVPTPESYRGNVAFTAPRAAYDESKRLSETLCQIYRAWGAPVRVVRPFNIYGPGEDLSDGRVVPSLIKALVDDTPFVVYGNGLNTRSFVYIADAVVQILAVMLDGQIGEAYNIGDLDCELTINQLAYLTQEVFPVLEITHASNEARTADQGVRRRPDTTKILKLALPPGISMRDGLRRTFAYYYEASKQV